MAVNLTNAESALKNYYLDAVTEQLNNHINPFLARINKTTQNVVGNVVKKLVVAGVNGGIGAGAEDGALPRSGSSNYLTFTTPLKNLYGTIEISDKAIRASQNDSGAMVNLLNYEMESLVKSGNFNLSRMLYGDGSGFLCDINSFSNGVLGVSTTQNLYEGMLVDFITLGGSVMSSGAGKRIKYVDKENNKIHIDITGMQAEIENCHLVIQGSLGKELTGLKAIFDTDSPLYGIERNVSNIMQPYKKLISLSVSELNKIIDDLEANTGNRPDTIICSLGVKRMISSMLLANGYDSPIVEIENGYKAATFNGIPIIGDRFCTKDTMYVLNSKDFTLNQLCDWQWLEDDDGRILKQVPGKPVYTATLVKYAELICSNPSGQAKITGFGEN